jgi:hypothetical protein
MSRPDPHVIACALAEQAEQIATALLGKPSRITRRELRFGNRGSVALCRDENKRGFWFDHERGEGERYFVEHRRLDIRGLEFDHVLRWHAQCRCVIALMTSPVENSPTGIHRTFLNGDGSKRERKMLGRAGIIRLSPDETVMLGLGVSEGVEDGLAVLLSGWSPVWAAASAGAIARLPVLFGIESLTIFADTDSAGIKAAEECAERWSAADVDTRISPPARSRHA